MIGQKNLLDTFEDLIERNAFPRFLILEGERGSGKRTLINSILPLFNSNYYVCEDVKVDTIREIINVAYTWTGGVFVIPDCDNMSMAGQNALLKVVEEPPKDTNFIITVEDRNNLLPTIRSRGMIYMMEMYTPQEILQYSRDKFDIDESEEEIIKTLCLVPEEVDIIYDYGITEFTNYVRLVVKNIGAVSGANSFKIASKVSLKDGSDGYDLKMFWKSFINIAVELFSEERDIDQSINYLKYASMTGSYLQKLRHKGINKQMLFDTWILDIREFSYE